LAYAEATITSSVPEVLLAPRSAVLDTGTRAVAYVDRGSGAYEKRDVRVGRRGDAKVEILSGLAAGEKVVTQGNMMIDAEAQMAQPESLGVASGSVTAKEAEVPEVMMKQWTLLSQAAAALASDDLAAFNKIGVVPTASTSLAEARKAFYDAVQPAVEEALHHPGHVKIYECPMASNAFPGAPQKARWIQLASPLRNPWFGAQMLDCGSEVVAP
jgi:Cu(I)/Ag(I) efflux system membrane fusion protein